MQRVICEYPAVVMSSDPKRDDLTQLIREWKVAPRVDSSFRAAVWDRIGKRRSQADVSVGSWIVGARRLTAAVVILVTAGWTGVALARQQLKSDQKVLLARYVEELDPRIQVQLSQK